MTVLLLLRAELRAVLAPSLWSGSTHTNTYPPSEDDCLVPPSFWEAPSAFIPMMEGPRHEELSGLSLLSGRVI